MIWTSADTIYEGIVPRPFSIDMLHHSTACPHPSLCIVITRPREEIRPRHRIAQARHARELADVEAEDQGSISQGCNGGGGEVVGLGVEEEDVAVVEGRVSGYIGNEDRRRHEETRVRGSRTVCRERKLARKTHEVCTHR